MIACKEAEINGSRHSTFPCSNLLSEVSWTILTLQSAEGILLAVCLSVYLSKMGHITVIAQDVMNNAICVKGLPIENGSNHFSTKS